MFLASVAALFVAGTPCCENARACVELLRRLPASEAPSPRPLSRHCEAKVLETNADVTELIKLLNHPSWETRDAAAHVLGQVRPVSPATLPALHTLARRDPDGWANWALERIGDPSSAAVLVELRAKGRSGNTVDDPLWSAMVPLAIEAVPSADWRGRNQLFEIIVAHPERPRPVGEAKRLHALLLVELSKPEWPMPECGKSTAVVRGSRVFDACLPIAGVLIAAIERYGESASFAVASIEAASGRSPRLEPFIESALTRLGAESEMLQLAKDLRSSDRKVVLEALYGAMKVPDAGVLMSEVEGLLERSEPELASTAALALARGGRSPPHDLLRQFLVGPRLNDVENALVAAAYLGERAQALEPEITALLASQSPWIRRRAAEVYPVIFKRPGKPQPPPCLESAPPRRMRGKNTIVSCPPNAACLRATNRGEFGGAVALQLSDGGSQVLVDGVNPEAVLSVRGRRVVIEGLAHLSLRRGSVWNVVEGDGGVSMEFLTDLPGVPVSWRVDGTSVLVEVLTDEPSGCRYLLRVP